MLTVLTYWWSDPASKHKDKRQYTAEDVTRLLRSASRHLSIPHTLAVVTDCPESFDDSDIRAIPIDYQTHVPGRCFVRLMTFHPEGRTMLGERVLQMDLDAIVTGDLTPLAQRDEDLVLWRNPSRIPWDNPVMPGRPYYNTSMLLHRCGTMPYIWSEFDPVNPRVRDDQWWLSEKLGPNMPYWDSGDGVFRLARSDTPGSGVDGILPENARVVFFPGSEGKHWDAEIQKRNPWIKENWA